MKADSQVCQPNLYYIAKTKTKAKARTKANTGTKSKARAKVKARTKSKARTRSSSRVCVGQVGIKEDEKGWHHFHRDTCSDNLHGGNLRCFDEGYNCYTWRQSHLRYFLQKSTDLIQAQNISKG